MASPRLCFRSLDAEQTREIARRLSRAIDAAAGPRGLVIALVGDLGAGKTEFVGGLAEGLGLDPDQVASPTFVIAHNYGLDAPRALHHTDFYRLETAIELEATGFFDLLADPAVVAVEWADRFPDELPVDRLEVRIERVAGAGAGAGMRRFEASAGGPLSGAVLDCWHGLLAGLDDAQVTSA